MHWLKINIMNSALFLDSLASFIESIGPIA